MEKTFEIEMSNVWMGKTTITVTVRDGKVDTSAAEEGFYAYLRKNEANIIALAEEDELDALTEANDEAFKEIHAKEYMGTDDDMPDAYSDWLGDLTLDEAKKLLASQQSPTSANDKGDTN